MVPESTTGTYWSEPAEALLQKLKSGSAGLSAVEARARLRLLGPNALEVRKKATALGLFFRQFRSAIVLILLFATGVSAVLQDWVTAAIILSIVFGSALLSFTQEYHASTAVQKLKARLVVKATALRDGVPTSVPVEEVVPGDVVLLSAGNLVPADGVLLDLKDFYVSEAALTGETFPVEKRTGVAAPDAGLTARGNCVFMGTNVRSGTAHALIVETGKRTAYGQIAERLALRPPENEFERGTRHFGYLLTEVMLVLVLVVFAVNVIFHKPILDSLLFSVALAVGITPQLLPAIVSINLSKGSQTMAARGVLVRRLESIENFGSMDVLCTDKTGTLTQGVVRLDGAVDAEGSASAEVLRYARINAALETGLANAMDDAILVGAPVEEAVAKVDEVPYDFVRKRLSVVIEEHGGRVLITKGALANVLEVCSEMRAGGEAVALDEARRRAVRERFDTWSAQGLRVLGLATKAVPAQPAYTRDDERDLVFLGFLTFFDPPKEGVHATIEDLAALGVRLKIITGDSRLVAVHTAEAVGLEVAGVVTGEEFVGMRDEARWHAAERASIFAEVDPNQKEQIIVALQKMGHVVGYMGDGINDAPALLAADAGISVDQAVDVAKEAADFVLLERDLAVLHQGIVLGRTTFANTLKYIFITTSANFGNMFSMAGASLFLPFLPMLPAQILLTNLLTDLPAMALGGDSVDKELVGRPRRWDVRSIRDFMIFFGTESSIFDYATFGLLLLVFHASAGTFRTAWFVESAVTEIAVIFLLRTRGLFFRSRPARLLILASAAVAIAVPVLPYTPLGALLKFVPLPAPLMLALLAITAAYVVATEFTKWLFFERLGRGWGSSQRARAASSLSG
jgi:Mg2+-importing ATPase